MSESGFREVQLSGKQVVFLFMACIVAAVGVFLLGVKVGRGVVASDQVAQATPTPANDVAPAGSSGALPPAAAPKPGDLNYHETLQGRPEVKATPPGVPPAGTTAEVPAPSPMPAVPTPTQTPTPVVTSKPTPSPTTKPASSTAVWWVQVNSFSSTANAQKEVATLKAKGIDATVVDTGGSGARYKVKVGPLERAAADAARAHLLKEGYKPFPVSR